MSEQIQNYSEPLGKHDTQVIFIGSIFTLNHQFLASISSEGIVNVFDTQSQQTLIQVLLLNTDLYQDNDRTEPTTRIINSLPGRTQSYSKRINRDFITAVYLDIVDKSKEGLHQGNLQGEQAHIDITLNFQVGYEYGIVSLQQLDLTKVFINVDDFTSVRNRKLHPIVSQIAHSKSICMLKQFQDKINDSNQLVTTAYDKLLIVQQIDRKDAANFKLLYKQELSTLVTDAILFYQQTDYKHCDLKWFICTCQDGSIRQFKMKTVDFSSLQVCDSVNIVNYPLNKIQRYDFKLESKKDHDKRNNKQFLEELNVAMIIGDSANIILFEVDRKDTLIISAHHMNIKGACFHERFCITQGEDRNIKFWEMNTFRLLDDLRCHQDTINHVEICDIKMYSGGADQQVMFLDYDEISEKQYNFKEMEQEEIHCKQWNKKFSINEKKGKKVIKLKKGKK